MTAQKNFKKLVRARMGRTGESYTTARRHVIHAGHRVDGPLAARFHLPGSVPATAALRVLLAHAGVRALDGKPLSEAMVFGIAGGIGIGVFQFYYEKSDFASFFLAGRHYWHDDLPYAVGAFEELGLEPSVKEAGGAKAAEKNLREGLTGERPCMLWVDAANLPYLGLPAAFSGGGYHVITAYGVDDAEGIVWVGDCTDTPLKLSLEDLARARARIKKYKNRILWLESTAAASPLGRDDLERLVLSGIARCTGLLVRPAMKSNARNFQLAGLEAWAERLRGSSAKDSWENVFRPGANLWRGLTWIHDTIEHFGTGGGLCRYHMADFLEEAGAALGRNELRAVGTAYRELGRQWSDLARAALPDTVPEMQRARDLLARKVELLHDAAPPEAVRVVWDELAALEKQVAKAFPLSDEECEGLRAELKERVLAIHSAEVDALERLKTAAA